MRTKDYLPGVEAKLVEFTGAFLGRILTGYKDYGLSQTEAEEYQTTRQRFMDLYTLAIDDTTRTRVIVNEKNVAKKNAHQRNKNVSSCLRSVAADDQCQTP